MRETQSWRKAIGWLFSPFYIVGFFGILVFFHPVHLVAHIVSRKLHKRTLDLMNLSIVTNIRITGCASVKFYPPKNLPEDRPVILVANHQSMYDIPMMMWVLRSRDVGFIAKKELARWIPSISFSLRELSSVIIDRNDPKQAISAINEWAKRKDRDNGVAAIFPEGTRARDGVMKPFKSTGLTSLIKKMPNAVIQPVCISGVWEFLRYKFLPVPFGVRITCKFLDVIEPIDFDISKITQYLEDIIRKEVEVAEKVR